MRKVFIVTGGGSLGGHNRTALISALEMIRRGYEVHIVTGGEITIYQNYDIILKKISTSYFKNNHFLNLKSLFDFYIYAKEHKPDVIHAFDILGLVLGYFYCKVYKIKILLTICGGTLRKRLFYPKMNPVIVFSEEQYKGLIENKYYVKSDLFISPGRIDLVFNTFNQEQIKRYKNEIGLRDDCDIVLMISRFNSKKETSINHFLKISNFEYVNDCLQFLLVGENQNNELFLKISKQALNINKQFGYERIIVTEKGNSEARKLLPIAKIAIGVGRTAYEAMVKKIPTLVIGEYGFAGLANGYKCDELAEHNFSGRNAKKLINISRNEYKSYSVINKLISNSKYYCNVANSGKAWVNKNMDIRYTGELYNRLYNYNFSYYNKPSINDIIIIYIMQFARKIYILFKT